MDAEEVKKRERELIKKRAVIKSRLTVFSKALDPCDESRRIDAKHLGSRIARIEQDFEAFATIHDSLEELASDEVFEVRLGERMEFEENHYEAIRIARAMLNSIDENNVTRQEDAEQNVSARPSEPRVESVSQPAAGNATTPVEQPIATHSDVHVKLPKMDLPKFSGSYEAWPRFCDAFKSAVHDSPSFRDAQKLMYLRSCLDGKAAEKVESLETTAANYSVAWNILDKYYNDPSAVVNNRVKAFFELPVCSRSSAALLGELLDAATKHYRALRALNQPFLEAFPIYAVTSKMDMGTRLRWKEKTQSNPFPSVEDLLEFLHARLKVLETSQPEKSDKSSNSKKGSGDTHRSSLAHAAVGSSCYICKGSHFAYQCTKLTDSTVEQRFEIVKGAGLCINCLRPDHIAKNCTAGTCKQCKRKHHTLLHRDQPPDQPSVQTNVAALNAIGPPEVLLSTAIIQIRDGNGQFRACRVLLDSGSQPNFLTERTASKLGLIEHHTNRPVIGINQTISRINTMVKTCIKSRINNFNTELTFLILPKITEIIPSQSIAQNRLNIPNNIPLADPGFANPSEIEGLIGAEIFFNLLCVGQIATANNHVILQKTKLGWIVAGKLCPSESVQKPICNLARCTLQEQLAKFWEIEETTREIVLSSEEAACERHYQYNTTRDATPGKYVVKLPVKDNIQQLGESYTTALRRFRSLERKLAQDSDLQVNYAKFMNEYCSLGHMTKLENTDSERGYYLPHHAVCKQSSITTKLRVVFDASARTSTGVSLNNALMTGPTIQEDLFSIIVRFRSHSFVLTADIEKMYRQVLVHPDDRAYQKILWRSNPQCPIETYTLNTVTYGTSSAPFLAIRSLKQLSLDEGTQFPTAATLLCEDFYVDDLLTGAHTFEEAITIRDEMIQICARAGLRLRQWASNDETLLDVLENRVENTHVRLDLHDTIKTLGIHWNTEKDVIVYSIANMELPRRITKRSILSQIASLFDPLGLLGPIIVQAKLLMQTLWQLNLAWDESVPLEIHTSWSRYCQELHLLRDTHFDRQATAKTYDRVQMHGFCDASEKAYGACLYLRSTDRHGSITTRLLCSKSRVAPLKTITLPRLELCAAHLLAKLYSATIKALRRTSFDRIVFWSDSTVTLHWINSMAHSLKIFVAHRVADIQTITDKQQWRHVPSIHNPADLVSRGMSPKEFVHNQLWYHGPSWLNESDSSWPQYDLVPIDVPEMRAGIALSNQLKRWDVLENCSSFQRLRRVIAYCLRFTHNSTHRERLAGVLTVDEIRAAEVCVVKILQRENFAREIQGLRSNKIVKGNLAPLSPFLDEDNILRVGGRLARARIPYLSKHPILLPKNHSITTAIVRDEHLRHFHSGTQATLSFIRQRFWIPGGKDLVRRVIHKCVTCYRARPPGVDYTMADLPEHRVIQSRPFLNTGVDFCGPIYIKEKTYRNKNKIKVYLAIFVCFATKAIHIEIVGDLWTEAFLAALRRFFARRGKCSDLYSDNATNFVGARREIKELFANIRTPRFNNAIAENLNNEGIKWHLIPPRSPHFGGLWEAAVKSTKYHLVRVIGDTLLSYEALLTYVNQIEAILNSRPLTQLSSDPNDLNALTPSHFLIGDNLASIPSHDFTAVPAGRLSMWQHSQQLQQHFWKRWSREYLHEQVTRKKWHSTKSRKIDMGALVILREDNVPPMNWPLGRIID